MFNIPNPYQIGGPIRPEMFFGREDVFEFVYQALDAKHRDNALALYGPPRIGKTSILYQMRSRLDTRYLCIVIDLSNLYGIKSLGQLLLGLANSIVHFLRNAYQLDLPLPNLLEFMVEPYKYFENEFLNQIWSAIGDRQILLMLDETETLLTKIWKKELEPEVFVYIRHLIQHYEQMSILFSIANVDLGKIETDFSPLFSGGLLKKISYLDRDAAIALITHPIKDYYRIEPAALERILQLTSGHPYYTQMMCSSLFNHWQPRYLARIDVQDINEILDRVLGQASRNLNYAYELFLEKPYFLTIGEMAIMAGLAAVMDNSNLPVGVDDIKSVWTHYHVVIPQQEIENAIGSLVAKDIIFRESIISQDKYAFRMDLQRLSIKEEVEFIMERITQEQLKEGSTIVFEKEKMLKVFLCHSSGDKLEVRKLYHRLQASNIDPWLDEENLLPGQYWEDEIRKAVRTADIVIVCLSRGSTNKTGFVQKEIKFALDVAEEQPEGTIFLIPLKLEECSIPMRLSHLQWVNLFETKGYNKLIYALQKRAETLDVIQPIIE